MKLSLVLGALTLPLLFIPSLLAVWLAASCARAGRRYAFTRHS